MALTDRGKRYLEIRNEPALRAFLDTVAELESKNDYGVIVGGSRVESFADHPKKLQTVHFGGKPVKSTAAGRYQIIKASWEEAQRNTGVKDFSPLSQDLAAIYLIDRKGALEDILDGDYITAERKLAGTWAKLPTSDAGQNPASMKVFQELINKHQIALGKTPAELAQEQMAKLTEPKVKPLPATDPVEKLLQEAWNNRPADSVPGTPSSLEPVGAPAEETSLAALGALDDSEPQFAAEEPMDAPAPAPDSPAWIQQAQQMQAQTALPPQEVVPAEEALLNAMRLDLEDFRQAALDKFMGRETNTDVKLPPALEKAIARTVALL